MFITNFEELINSGTIKEENYVYCDKDQTLELIKFGFIPIGCYNEQYVFNKEDKLIWYLQGGEEICSKI